MRRSPALLLFVLTVSLLGCRGFDLGRLGAPGFGPDGPAPGNLVADVRQRLDRAGVDPLEAAPTVSAALFDLGQALAFDKILSGNRDLSCMTCHHPSLGSDDDRTLPAGAGATGLGSARRHPDGVHIPRNAPALFNLHSYETMFWDGRVEVDGGGLRTPAGSAITPTMKAVFDHGVVSAQAMFPVTSAAEMRGLPGSNELANLADDDFAGIWAGLMTRLGDVPTYRQMFEAAYPGESFNSMTFAHAANAIAAFEVAGFESRGSPLQAFLAGDDGALDATELRGAQAFFRADCDECHAGEQLSDFDHHNTGLAQLGPGAGHGPGGRDDYGREGVTGRTQDRYRFRTTPLHNVELTGPYSHAGQLQDLDDVIDHYDRPDRALRDYRVTAHVDDASLHGTVLDNVDAVLGRLSNDLENGPVRERDEIVRFLQSMTDPDALDLRHLVPASVPSGLPVAD